MGFNTQQWNGNPSTGNSTGVLSAAGLIYGALRLIGGLRAGTGTNPESMADAFTVLNEMLDAWNADRLKIYSIQRNVFRLNGGKRSYEIGDGGADIDFPRPVRIDGAGFLFSPSTDEIELPLQVCTLEQWEAEGLKGIQTPYPSALYCDYAMPANLFLWPVPSTAFSLVLYLWQSLAAFVDFDTTITFPPAYARALRYNLAVALYPMFLNQLKVKVDIGTIEAQAEKYLFEIKKNNVPRPILVCGPEFSRRGGGWYDGRAGRYR